MNKIIICVVVTILLFKVKLAHCQNSDNHQSFLSFSLGNSLGVTGIPVNLYYGKQKNQRITFFASVFKNITKESSERFTTFGGGVRFFSRSENIFSSLHVKPFTEVSLNFIVSKHLTLENEEKNKILYKVPVPRISLGTYLGESKTKGLLKFNFSAFTFLEAGIVKTL